MEWGKFARSADRLGIQRSDYMLHQSSSTNNNNGDADDADDDGDQQYSIKQVELNTIASSFAGLASTVAKLHGFMTCRLENELTNFLNENERAVMGGKNIVGGNTSSSDDDTIVIMIIEVITFMIIVAIILMDMNDDDSVTMIV